MADNQNNSAIPWILSIIFLITTITGWFFYYQTNSDLDRSENQKQRLQSRYDSKVNELYTAWDDLQKTKSQQFLIADKSQTCSTEKQQLEQQLDEQQGKQTTLNQQLEQCQKEQQQKTTRDKDSQQRILELETALAEQKSTQQKQAAELANIKSEYAEYQEQFADQEQVSAKNNEMIAQLNETIEAKTSKIEAQTENIAELTQQLNEEKTRNENLTSQYKELESKHNELAAQQIQAGLIKQQLEHCQLQSNKNNHMLEELADLKKLREKLIPALGQCRFDLKAAKAQLAQKISDSEQNANRKSEKEKNQNDSAENPPQASNTSSSQMAQTLPKNEEIAELQQQLTQCQASSDEKQNKIDTLQNTLDTIQSQLNVQKQKLARTEQKLTKSAQQLVEKEQETGEISSQLTQKQTELNACVNQGEINEEQKQEQLQKNAAAQELVQQQLNTLQLQLQTSEQSNQQLIQDKETLIQKIDGLAQQLDEKSNQVQGFNRQLSECENKLTAETAELNNTRVRVKLLEVQVNNEVKKNQECQDNLLQEQSNTKRLQAAQEKLSSDLQESTQTQQEMEQLIEQVNQRNEDLQVNMESLQAEQKKLAQRLADETNNQQVLSRKLIQINRQKAEKSALETQELIKLRELLKSEIDAEFVTIEEVKQDRSIRIKITNNLLFRLGDSHISRSGAKILKQVAEVLKKFPHRKIKVVGHTDNIPVRKGSSDFIVSNWELSAARAAAAIRYLQHGANVAPERMHLVGASQYQPIADGRTKTGRAANRRIEICLLAPEI